MKNLFISISLALLILAGQSCNIQMPTRGNSKIVSTEIDINDYKEFIVIGSGNVIYEQKAGETPYLKIETDENIMPLMDIRSENGVLVIKAEKSINPTKMNIYTNSSSLSKINCTGSANIRIESGINISALNIDITGSGNVTGDSITCQKFAGNVVGSGEIKISGTASDISTNVLGSGSVDINQMPAKTANCKISGSGNSTVNVSETLKAKVLGSGNVKYRGNPQTESSIVGSGSIASIN